MEGNIQESHDNSQEGGENQELFVFEVIKYLSDPLRVKTQDQEKYDQIPTPKPC